MLGLSVFVESNRPASTKFRISLRDESHWRHVKINFFSSTRPDLEIGTAFTTSFNEDGFL